MKDTMIFITLFVLFIVISVLVCYLSNHFDSFKPRVVSLDMSNKKERSLEDYKDFVILQNKNIIEEHEKQFEDYMLYINKMRDQYANNKYRLKQIEDRYNVSLDAYNYIRVIVYRDKTKYQQVNYIKTAYTVKMTLTEFIISLAELKNIYEQLELSNFKLTRSEYFSKDQRKLMTSELRLKIKIRDNYTCQCCGKYMPDSVGIHIDHITPVSKGGKTIEENLQVLCSNCNLKKSAK